MFDLADFTLSDMTKCGIELRKLGAGASSMEEVAQRIVRYLHEKLRASGSDATACALVRFFVTAPYSELDADLQAFARGMLGDAPDSPALKCLTLLATAGEIPAWNSRHESAGHKALPLRSAESVARSPMIAQLIRQFGIEVRSLLAPDPDFVVDAEQHTFNVFHVAEATGSPYIPAQQEFVIPHGIRSVLGFGGLLPSGELFAIILFAREPIPRQTADLFKTLALNAKVAILPFVGRRLFA
jgi:hypothetical protein